MDKRKKKKKKDRIKVGHHLISIEGIAPELVLQELWQSSETQ